MKGALVVDCGDYSDNSFFFLSFPQFYSFVGLCWTLRFLELYKKSLISSRSVISAFLTCASAALLLSSSCSSQVSPCDKPSVYETRKQK